MKEPQGIGWLLLVLSLSGRRATPRMRVWRALKTLGAGVLRDGVYVLPAGPSARQAFEGQAREVVRAGGTAHVLAVTGGGAEQERRFRALFNRDADYVRISGALQRFRASLGPRRRRTAVRDIRALRRSFTAVQSVDHFPGPEAGELDRQLAETEAAVEALIAAGEPRAVTGTIEPRDVREYQGRTWVTRARPWVDRLASAWLIRRFIDKKARIRWLAGVNKRNRSTLGFDFDNAEFTHVGQLVTFEVLLHSFGLAGDPVLTRIAAIVHCLDVGGIMAPGAEGVALVLRGARERHRRDDELFAEAGKVFDNLYSAFSQEARGS